MWQSENLFDENMQWRFFCTVQAREKQHSRLVSSRLYLLCYSGFFGRVMKFRRNCKQRGKWIRARKKGVYLLPLKKKHEH
jgi:hypothetical protein